MQSDIVLNEKAFFCRGSRKWSNLHHSSKYCYVLLLLLMILLMLDSSKIEEYLIEV